MNLQQDDSVRAVWKYELETNGVDTELSLPEGSTVIEFCIQVDRFCAWVVVDPKKPHETRTFVVVRTGARWRHRHLKYVGSCHEILARDHCVWHLLERRRNEA